MSGSKFNAEQLKRAQELHDLMHGVDSSSNTTTTQPITPPYTPPSTKPSHPPHRPTVAAGGNGGSYQASTTTSFRPAPPPTFSPPVIQPVATTSESISGMIAVLLGVGVALVIGNFYVWSGTIFEWIGGAILVAVVALGIVTLLSGDS